MAFCTVDFYSRVLDMDVSVNVLLPEKRHKEHTDCSNKKYPVLYLLHGHSDDHSAWIRKSMIEYYTRDLDLIVIMPSTLRGFYTDEKHGLEYFTYISEELPLVMKNFFPISDKRENTFVAGNSMGGYGAFKLAMTYPQRYAGAASLSGALTPYEVASSGDTANIMGEKFIASQKRTFGEIDEFYESENDLLHLASLLNEYDGPKPILYQCYGKQDHLTYNFNKLFQNHIKDNCPKLDVIYEESDGGHNWFYWNPQINQLLQYFRLK